MYFNNGFDSTYDELITMYPAFYRDVLEMRAILEAEGKITDKVIAEINRVIDNSFVLSADEKMISRFETFLGIPVDEKKSLEERRQNISVCFFGLGKLSASKLKETIDAIAETSSEITFAPADEARNNRLDVLIPNPKIGFEPELVLSLLRRRLPAHLWYKVNIRHDSDGKIYIGFAIRQSKKMETKCETASIEPATFLADDFGRIIVNEDKAWISVETEV